jgi:hypothetical protein
MTFRKFFMQWLMTTGGFVVLAYLAKSLAPTHTLWPFAMAFLYLGVLILLLCKALMDVVGQKA